MGTPNESLRDVTLEHLLRPEQSVMHLRPSHTIGEALSLLAQKKVLSAPVFAENSTVLQSWVDLQAILRGLLTHLKEKHGKLPTAMLLLVKELEEEGPVFAAKPLSSVSPPPSIAGEPNGHVQDRVLVKDAEASALSVIELIRSKFLPQPDGRQVVHRCAVVSEDGSVLNIVSQVDVVRYLVARPHLLGSLATVTLSQVPHIGRSAPITVDAHVPTILALDGMLKSGISAAPVISSEGELAANLSISDLRCIQAQHLGILGLPVAEFVAVLHRTTYLGYAQGTPTRMFPTKDSHARDHPFFATRPITFAPPSSGLRSGSDSAPASPPMSHGSVPQSALGSSPPCGGGAAVMAGHLRMRLMGSDGSGNGAAGDTIRLITCHADMQFLEVMQLLCVNKVHRLYVVDAAQPTRVTGVITPTDILKAVLHACS